MSKLIILGMRQVILKIKRNHLFRGLVRLGNIYQSPVRHQYANMSDMDILRRDWNTIGEDMVKAFNIYRKEVDYAR